MQVDIRKEGARNGLKKGFQVGINSRRKNDRKNKDEGKYKILLEKGKMKKV